VSAQSVSDPQRASHVRRAILRGTAAAGIPTATLYGADFITHFLKKSRTTGRAEILQAVAVSAAAAAGGAFAGWIQGKRTQSKNPGIPEASTPILHGAVAGGAGGVTSLVSALAFLAMTRNGEVNTRVAALGCLLFAGAGTMGGAVIGWLQGRRETPGRPDQGSQRNTA